MYGSVSVCDFLSLSVMKVAQRREQDDVDEAVASSMVKEAIARGAKRVIAGGGDGTINAVVNALVGKGKKNPKATMGVLPLGTANDFAHGLGLPCDDLKQCLEIACTAKAKPIDVGRANKRSFINVTSGGFGAEITATTPVGMKKALGGGAYTLMGLIKAFGLEPYKGRLLIPGREPIEGSPARSDERIELHIELWNTQ